MDSILAVTSAAADPTLLTLAELRAAAGVSDASQDAVLTIVGRRVSAMIASACRVARAGAAVPTLRQETMTETYRRKSWAEHLALSRLPVVSVTSVTVDGTALDAADYEVDPTSGLLTRLSSGEPTCWGCGKHVVVYVAGWAEVPEDLKLAASRMVGNLLSDDARGGDTGLKREEIPGVITREWWVSEKETPAVPSDVMEMLAAGGYVMNWI